MREYIIYGALTLLSFLVSYFTVPFAIKFAKKMGIIDNPKQDDRRVHKEPTPRVGGIAMVAGMAVTIITFCILCLILNMDINTKLIGYAIGGLIIVTMGFVDDMKNLRPLYKFLFQLIAGMVIYVFGISIAGVKIPFLHPHIIDFGLWSFPLTLAWVLGITNAVNLIDGLDGLAAGISAIASISLLVIFSLVGAGMEVIVITLALAGATIGFLPYNFNPAKTFMGDTGSNFLGFTLSTVSIMGMAKGYTILAIVTPIIVCGVPVFDMLFAIIRRLAKHQKITAPDKGHIHHRLLKHGFSQKQAVLILYGLTSILGIIAVTLVSGFTVQGIICIAVAIIIWAIGYIYNDMKVRRSTMIPEETSKEDKN